MVSYVIDEFKISALSGSTERRVYTSVTILLDGFIVMWSKKYIIHNTSEFKLHFSVYIYIYIYIYIYSG